MRLCEPSTQLTRASEDREVWHLMVANVIIDDIAWTLTTTTTTTTI